MTLAPTSTRRVLLIENDSAVNDRVLIAPAERDCRVTCVALGTGAEVVRGRCALDGLALVPAMFISSERYDPAHPESAAGVVLRPFLMLSSPPRSTSPSCPRADSAATVPVAGRTPTTVLASEGARAPG
jgi:hypothetical protein